MGPTDLLQLPLILGVVTSVIVLLKNQNWRTTGTKGLLALGFWALLYVSLYAPNLMPNQNIQFVTALSILGARFNSFARYFQGFDLLAEVWIASLVVDSTVRFTGTHAGLPRKVGSWLDGIVVAGVSLIFLAFMSGAF